MWSSFSLLYFAWHGKIRPHLKHRSIRLFCEFYHENVTFILHRKQTATIWIWRYLQVQRIIRSLRFSIRFRFGVRLCDLFGFRFGFRIRPPQKNDQKNMQRFGIDRVDSKPVRSQRTSGGPRVFHSVSSFKDTWTLFGLSWTPNFFYERAPIYYQ